LILRVESIRARLHTLRFQRFAEEIEGYLDERG